jgi:diaminopimelate epimerase
MTIEFSKYHGAGNDFIIIDGRDKKIEFNNHILIKNICHRRFGIGADGVIILENDLNYDFKMIYFNSDGYEGTMCGNGGRCIFSFAYSLGLINNVAKFIASDGIHEAYLKNETIHLKMNAVSEIIKLKDGFFINTGSPHFVRIEKEANNIDVESLGKKIRYQKRFAPDGVNVNFVSLTGNNIQIATYERGVEAETLSCGTGSVASALAFTFDKPDGNYTYILNAKGGTLSVSFQKSGNNYHDIWLSGPAVKVFDGRIDTEKLTIY